MFVFDIVFVLKCKSENDKGVIPTDPDRFQPYFGWVPPPPPSTDARENEKPRGIGYGGRIE